MSDMLINFLRLSLGLVKCHFHITLFVLTKLQQSEI